MLGEEQIQQNKEEIINLLRSTNRDGVESLISFLEESGYFYLYGSFKHHPYKGGLAEHSLEVVKYALSKNTSCAEDSIIICGLLHDLCKVKYDFPEDIVLEGHGSKSIGILETFLKFPLSYEEYNAIRFHMGKMSFIRNEDDRQRYKDAKKSELWQLIHIGDCISAGRTPRIAQGLLSKIIRLIGF